MAYGDGSITQVSRGIWKVRVDFGKDPITGKRQVVSRNVRGSKAEARKVRDQIRKEHESGIKADAGKITLSKFIEIWAEAKRTAGKASDESIKDDCGKLKHVETYIGNVPLTEIDASTIERVYALIREDRNLGGTSMNRIHSLLKSVLKKAVDYDLLLRNPCDRVEAPRKDDPERKALDEQDCKRLAKVLDDAENEERANISAKEQRMEKIERTASRSAIRGICSLSCLQAIRIGLATGMRRGEILGLEWGSVDFEKQAIAVVQSRTKAGYNKAPKTKAGIRSIHIDAATAARLQQWKTLQTTELAKLGIECGENTPVCCSDKGSYIDPPNFERFWRKFKQEHGFEGLKIHELRHTQATQLLSHNVDVKTVQTRMGHSNASITLNWYAHAVPENDEKAADLLGSILGTANPEPSSALLESA